MMLIDYLRTASEGRHAEWLRDANAACIEAVAIDDEMLKDPRAEIDCIALYSAESFLLRLLCEIKAESPRELSAQLTLARVWYEIGEPPSDRHMDKLHAVIVEGAASLVSPGNHIQPALTELERHNLSIMDQLSMGCTDRLLSLPAYDPRDEVQNAA